MKHIRTYIRKHISMPEKMPNRYLRDKYYSKFGNIVTLVSNMRSNYFIRLFKLHALIINTKKKPMLKSVNI